MSLKVNFFNDRVTSITFIDNEDEEIPDIVNYSNVFLRDASDSPDSIEKASNLKLFSTASIARNITPKEQPKVVTTPSGESAIEIAWDDGNVSVYTESFLKKYSCADMRRRGKFYEENEDLWDKRKMEKKKKDLIFKFDKFENDDKTLATVFRQLNHYGIAFVTDIPTESSKTYTKSSLEQLASRIGYLKETINGRYFDVISKKEAEHLVLSNKMFHLHQDLLFYQSPPGLKLIESIKNKVEGGENVFVDLFNAARYVLEKDPHAYFALCNVPVTYQYKDKERGLEFVYSRPVIVEDLDNIDPSTNYPFIKEVNYSPPSQGPFEYGITSPMKKMGDFKDWDNLDKFHSAKETGDRYLFRDFHRGLIIFEEFLHDEENQFKISLEEGEAVIFNNRRLAHARKQFTDEIGGGRWFRVGYVDYDVFYSRLRYFYNKYGEF